SQTAPTGPMVLDTSFYEAGATLTGAVVADCIPDDADCIPYEPWKNVRFATWDGDTLTCNTSVGWNAGASSVEQIEGDGFVEFTTAENYRYKAAGLGHGDDNQDFADIDFGFYLGGNGHSYISEPGLFFPLGPYAAGDKFRVEVVDGQVRYRKDGHLVHSSWHTPQLPLLLDTSLYEVGATLTQTAVQDCLVDDSDCMPYEPWKNLRFATWDGSTLTCNTSVGWSAGASSVVEIAGDGFVEFSTAENTRYKAAGLGHGDANQDYGDIEFAFYLGGNGHAYIYEPGAPPIPIQPYKAGDKFRVAVVNKKVTYLINEMLVHTSTATPTPPLVFDTSLYEIGATLNAVVVKKPDPVEYQLPFHCEDMPGAVEVLRGPMTAPTHSSDGKSGHAVDFAIAAGKPVYPMAPGVVVVKYGSTVYGEDCYDGGSGCWDEANLVTIRHPDGMQSIYAHLNTVSVAAGDAVTLDTVLGTAGATGDTGGVVHLHVARQEECTDASGWCESLPLVFPGATLPPKEHDLFCQASSGP
ncbi:MAG: M23 family metallopeptidase, partial [Aeromicrobium sp.]